VEVVNDVKVELRKKVTREDLLMKKARGRSMRVARALE